MFPLSLTMIFKLDLECITDWLKEAEIEPENCSTPWEVTMFRSRNVTHNIQNYRPCNVIGYELRILALLQRFNQITKGDAKSLCPGIVLLSF